MTLTELLNKLKGARRSGDGWVALCPAHDDRTASLSVSERNGRLLLHCHAGCPAEAVLKSLGLGMADLFTGPPTKNGSGRIVATYHYTDENGGLLFQVVRFEPKTFKQRRPDGKGGWIWNLTGVRRVLYGLPEVLKAEFVLVPEGERDVETAQKLGFVAACNPGGAGKWHSEYSESLRGKRVAIIADADEPGRKHAQDVARTLVGVAESVKVLELPRKDLSEWCEGGGTRAGLLALLQVTPELTAADVLKWSPPQNGGFQLTSLKDLLAEPEERVNWIVENHLPAAGLSVLVSKPKVGKSTLARCLALAVARGEPFLGWPTTQGAVIYLALEEKRSEVRAHFRAMGATDEPIYIHAAHAPLDALPAVREIAQQQRPALIIVDPLQKMMRVKDGNDYAEVTLALEQFLILARETGSHLAASHHAGKGERADPTDSILGSTAIFGGVDTAIILKKTERYRTIQSAQRYGEDIPETVLEFDPETRTLSLGESKATAEEQRISAAILDHLSKNGNQPQTEPQINDAVEGRLSLKRTALRNLVKTGKLTKAGSGRKGDPFTYVVRENS
jgi:Mrp family chromosome partitioning ATPase